MLAAAGLAGVWHEAAIWTRALSAAEATALSARCVNYSVPNDSLYVYYNFGSSAGSSYEVLDIMGRINASVSANPYNPPYNVTAGRAREQTRNPPPAHAPFSFPRSRL